jgi:hypothetical protein
MLIDPQKSEQPSQDNLSLMENSCPRKSKPWQGQRNLLLGMGGVGVLLFGGSIACGHYFVQTQIAPLVENRLADFINRPVKIGAVQAVSLHHIRFGQTEFLPTTNDRQYSKSALAKSWGLIDQGLTPLIPETVMAVGKSRETAKFKVGISPTDGASTLAIKRGGLIGDDNSWAATLDDIKEAASTAKAKQFFEKGVTNIFLPI